MSSSETFYPRDCPSIMISSPQDRKPGPEQPEKSLTPDSTQPEEKPEDEVEEAGEESFPASDAPSWTGAAAH